MSVYSSVKATELKNTAISALTEISNHNLTKNINALNSSILSSKFYKSINKKMGSIINSTSINGSIKVLEKKLNNLKSAMEKIETIKSKENLIYAYRYYNYYRDENNEIKPYYKSQIYYLQNDISNLESQISNLLN